MRRTSMHKTISLALGLLIALGTGTVPALAAGPRPRALAAIVPGGGCAADGVVAPVSCHLYATTGTLALPSGPVTVLGYSSNPGGPAEVPGPTIVVDEGDAVTVTLHNELSVTTALSLPQLAVIPDQTGVAAAGSKDYGFTATRAGTYLYEAGGPNGPRQTGAGMAGVIVVQPLGGITQTDEHVLVLSEIDTSLNADPAGFDLRRYSPDYLLINGRVASASTSPVAVDAGTSVLLRYVNVGLRHHSVGLLGLDQRFTAMDGFPFPAGGYAVVSEALAPGQTAEAVVAIPGTAALGTRYPLYDGSFLGGSDRFGGMLTHLLVSGSAPPPGGAAPVTSNVAVNPNPSIDGAVTVTAVVIDPDSIGVTGSELFLDGTGVSGTGIAGGAPDFNSWSLVGVPSGVHTVYVHAADAADGWGPFASATFRVDADGPVVTGAAAWPNPSSGQVLVNLAGSAGDGATGGSTIASAEYRVDGGPPSPMMVTPPSAVTASLDAVIPATTMQGLAVGTHTVEMRATDTAGHTGSWASFTLTVSTEGPTTTELVINPTVTDGTQGYNPSIAAVRVDALFTGAAANVAGGEGFIDVPGAGGSGFPLTPKDGLYNSPSERGFAYIPLSTVVQLPEGVHQIWVHGRDASGNWGELANAPLFVDKLPPTTSSVTASPNPTNGAGSLTLGAVGQDNVTNITAAEWFEGTDPGVGLGHPMSAVDGTFDSSTESVTAGVALNCFAAGIHTLWVRVKDGNKHWSSPVSVSVDVNQQANDIFSDGFESGTLGAWDAVAGTVSVTTGAALSGTYGMSVTLAGNNVRYVTNNCPAGETSYRAGFRFNPNAATSNNNGYAVLSALNPAGTSVLRVDYRRLNTGVTQLRIAVVRAGGTTVSAWSTISNAAHDVVVRWSSAVSSTTTLSVDGSVVQTLSGLDTSAQRIETVRLGPSTALPNNAAGTMYFDQFSSWRTTP